MVSSQIGSFGSMRQLDSRLSLEKRVPNYCELYLFINMNNRLHYEILEDNCC